MTKSKDGKEYSLNLRLRPGRYLYKYIVDGEWTHTPSQPFSVDAYGNINNVIEVNAPPNAGASTAAHNKDAVTLMDVSRPVPPAHTSVTASAVARVPDSGRARASSLTPAHTDAPQGHAGGAVAGNAGVVHGSAASGGYIGMGVAREMFDEYHLTVASSAKAGMPRSMTVNDVASLQQVGSASTRAWRRGPTTAASRGLPYSTPRMGAAATPDTTATSDLDLAGAAEAAGISASAGPTAMSAVEISTPSDDVLGMPLESDTTASAAAPSGFGTLAASWTPASAGSPRGGSDVTADSKHAQRPGLIDTRPPSNSNLRNVPATPSPASATEGAGQPTKSSSTSSIGALAVDKANVGIPVSIPLSSVGMRTSSLLTPSGATATLTNVQASLRREGKTVLAMVGLPARGKTFMARRLKRHLSWMGYKTEIYNGVWLDYLPAPFSLWCTVSDRACAVGNYRRKILGANQPAGFFDPTNEAGEAARREMARIACDEMVDALRTDVTDIAIFDATNTTLERRRWLQSALTEAEGTWGIKFQLVFVESICRDEEIIRANVRETKLKSPDYKDMPETEAVSDFLARIRHYESIYQPLDDAKESLVPYIKLIDVGRQIIANRINGYLNSRIMFFLSNLHITPRPIWLTRHGESEYNVQGRIGGDSLLAPRGHAYSLRLAAFMNKMYPSETHLTVWTSTLRRTMMTAAPTGREIIQWKALDEIDAGICDGMTYEAIAATMPDEYAARARNKFTYRYPAGESYQDIVHRLEPVIIELMRQKDPILIVSHQATLRVLYAYLTDKPPESCPDAVIPLHTIIQLTPKAYGCEEVRHELM